MTRTATPGLALVFLLTAVAVSAVAGPAAVAGPSQGTAAGAELADPAPAGAIEGVEPSAERPPPARAGTIEGVAQGQEFDTTEFHVTVYANGSARWEFVYRKTLENESERQQFQDFAEEFNTNQTQMYVNFRNRARGLTSEGTNATNRSMEARNFRREARISPFNDNQGVVRMSFLWTNFAPVDGNVVRVGDVFQGGLYVGESQWLYFHHGPDLRFRSATPAPDNNASTTVPESQWIGYRGPQQFPSLHPRVVLAPPNATETGGGPGPGTDTPPSGGFGMLPWAVLALVVVLGIGAAVAYRSGALSRSGGDGDAAGAATPGGSGGGGGAAASEPAVSDEELLSDEDRVLQLLEDHGGRMKQVNIVEETGWSKSKVSMLLSDMEEEDHISKLRVGRENIISLKGEEPDAAGSPFEDEG